MDQPSRDSRPPIAVAFAWASRITTIALEMVLPGLAGWWLDSRLGTRFLMAAGFVLGLFVGIWHLLAITKSMNGTTLQRKTGDTDHPDGGPE